MLRVRSIECFRLGELGELGFCAATVFVFSITASIFSVLFENKNAPNYFRPIGAL